VVFYRVSFREQRGVGVGYSRSESELVLPTNALVTDWKQPSMDLRDGVYADYLATDWGCRLCSEGMRKVLDEQASEHDQLQWLPVDVYEGNEARKYHVLHFPFQRDVLDRQKSLIYGERVVKPVLSASAAAGFSVFTYKGAGSLSLFISEPVADALRASKLTGIQLDVASSV
jgi:hypothetical protein